MALLLFPSPCFLAWWPAWSWCRAEARCPPIPPGCNVTFPLPGQPANSLARGRSSAPGGHCSNLAKIRPTSRRPPGAGAHIASTAGSFTQVRHRHVVQNKPLHQRTGAAHYRQRPHQSVFEVRFSFQSLFSLSCMLLFTI